MNYNEIVENQKEYVLNLRREFHMHPEASWKEFRTSMRIKEELDKMGIEWSECASTGVIATVKGCKNEKTVALRADMDALTVVEKTNVSYKSKNHGIMHACGHDGHTAMLLGAARALQQIKDKLSGNVKLIFQPAEEMVQGAKKIIQEGALSDVDGIMGIHLWNDIPVGKVNIECGPRMASADYFTIDFTRISGASQSGNPICAASSFILNSQAALSREKSPLDSATFTVGQFRAGTGFNVTPERARVEGTLRCFSEDTRKGSIDAIRRYSTDQAYSYGIDVIVNVQNGSPATVNDKKCTLIARESANKIVGKDGIVHMSKTTGSEDMAYYLEKIPGLIAFVGSGSNTEKTYPHHHSKFNIDENSLFIGCSLYFNFALDFLEKY